MNNNKNEGYHIPVLLMETIDVLNINENGIYVDGTAGGGGHSFAIASKLTGGHLYSIDQDIDAVNECKRRLKGLNATVVKDNFENIDKILEEQQAGHVDGILLDLGVSSHQLDDAERGFSYHQDAALDMRMDRVGKSAAEVVNTYDERSLLDIFYSYGEEKHSGSIVRAILKERENAPIETTLQLAEIIKDNVPMKYRRMGHPARKVFQALRIEVNRELSVLKNALEKSFEVLNVGGRFAVITFHSIEDRIVKREFVKFCTGCICPPTFPVCMCGKEPRARQIVRKVVIATDKELLENPRSRSAKLRCIEKIND